MYQMESYILLLTIIYPFGGLDIMIATRKGGISIENPGKPLNSEGDDFGILLIKQKDFLHLTELEEKVMMIFILLLIMILN